MKKIWRNISANHLVQLLTDTPYLSFSLSVFFSQVASNMLTIVLIFLIFHLTSSNFSVSILLLSILIPQIFVSFLGGVIADTFNKKKILVIGNILRALLIVILFLNFHSPLLIYVLAFLISTITQFYVPAESPLIPSLVGREKLVAANSIFGMSFFGSVLIGYVLAGPLVRVAGRGNAFLVILLLFVIAAFFAAFINQKINGGSNKLSPESVKKSIRMEFHESFVVLRKTRDVGNAFFLLIFSQVIIFILATLVPGYAKSILQIPAEDLSLFLFAPAAVGMIVAGFGIGGIFHNTSKKKLTTIGIFISGLVLLLFPFTSKILSPSIVVFVILISFFAGLANALIFIPSQAVIQESTPKNFTSKIYGLLFALIGVFSLFPIIVAGGVADVLGVGVVLFSLGVLVILLGFIRAKT